MLASAYCGGLGLGGALGQVEELGGRSVLDFRELAPATHCLDSGTDARRLRAAATNRVGAIRAEPAGECTRRTCWAASVSPCPANWSAKLFNSAASRAMIERRAASSSCAASVPSDGGGT